jgi:hypothetical protein
MHVSSVYNLYTDKFITKLPQRRTLAHMVKDKRVCATDYRLVPVRRHVHTPASLA